MTFIPADCIANTTRKARRVLFLHVGLVNLVASRSACRSREEELDCGKFMKITRKSWYILRLRCGTYQGLKSCGLRLHLNPARLDLFIKHDLFFHLNKLRMSGQILSVGGIIMMNSLKNLPGLVVLSIPDEPVSCRFLLQEICSQAFDLYATPVFAI